MVGHRGTVRRIVLSEPRGCLPTAVFPRPGGEETPLCTSPVCSGWFPCHGPIQNSKPLMPMKQQVDSLSSNSAAPSGWCGFSPYRLLGGFVCFFCQGWGAVRTRVIIMATSQWVPTACQALGKPYVQHYIQFPEPP